MAKLGIREGGKIRKEKEKERYGAHPIALKCLFDVALKIPMFQSIP